MVGSLLCASCLLSPVIVLGAAVIYNLHVARRVRNGDG